MLINEKIEIIVNNHSLKYYLLLGYEAKYGKKILINSTELTKSSNVIVKCKCDNCENIKELRFQDYNKIIKKQDHYYCSKCKGINIKNTKRIKYGDENYNNREQYEKTMLEKYDVVIPLQNLKLKEKKEKTNLEKYGFKNASENKNIKNKISKTLTELYSNKSFLKKIKENYIHICKEKYGVNFFTQSEIYIIKNRETCLKKYGYEHNGSVPELIKKRKETYELNHKNNIDINDFKKYKNKVIYQTSKIIKSLFEKWDGYDYYDNEFIAENLTLNFLDKEYPTIDHKKSIYYGLKNGIDIKEIANIDNLCITKKTINSSKGKKCEN